MGIHKKAQLEKLFTIIIIIVINIIIPLVDIEQFREMKVTD